MKNRVIVSIVLALILLLGVIGINEAAPEYDELLTANAALNCPSNVFIENVFWIKGQCLPLMLSSYIGGILALPYKILFIVFPSSVLIFRLFNLILLVISLIFLYRAVENFINKKTALITTFLLGFDFQLLFNIRFDRTAAFPFFIKSIVIYLSSLYYQRRSKYLLFLTGIFIGLSIWTKFDAIFFYLAILIGYLVGNFRKVTKIQKYIKTAVKEFIVFISGLLLGVFPLALYFKNNLLRFISVGKEIGKSDLVTVIPNKVELLLYQFSSFDSLWYIFREKIDKNILIVLLTSLIWILITYLFVKFQKNRVTSFLLVSFFIYNIFYLLFGGLIFSHHRFLIYPIPHILFSSALLIIDNKLKNLFLIVWLLIFTYSYIMLTSISITNGGRVGATKNIYKIYDNVKDLKSEILVGDWGITNQLLIISDGKIKLNEVAFAANVGSGGIDDALLVVLKKCEYILLRNERNAIFKNARKNILGAINPDAVYTDEEFELYQCK